MAIAEYAPGAEVVADGKMYVSRYIRKMPGKNADAAWEKGFYCPKCPTCGQPNFTKDPVTGSGRECVSCHTPIKRLSWRKTLEPRMGFCAEKTPDLFLCTAPNTILRQTITTSETRIVI